MLKVEPEISTHRTLPLGACVSKNSFPRYQWTWDDQYGCYVRMFLNVPDAYCMGDRLIFKRSRSQNSSYWVNNTTTEWDTDFGTGRYRGNDFEAAMKWLMDADYKEWGCLLWSYK